MEANMRKFWRKRKTIEVTLAGGVVIDGSTEHGLLIGKALLDMLPKIIQNNLLPVMALGYVNDQGQIAVVSGLDHEETLEFLRDFLAHEERAHSTRVPDAFLKMDAEDCNGD